MIERLLTRPSKLSSTFFRINDSNKELIRAHKEAYAILEKSIELLLSRSSCRGTSPETFDYCAIDMLVVLEMNK